ncbi:AMP-binding protein [Thalassomonas sp. RHCl1]|uniref:AMP-binding protein n=1 Tax=Thalassomonas sp. RHCl1 TaxID=2995320 RepID=UPI00248CDF67|nr:AMP-binding protein [Thalassomonas sp. RHCl1]
MTVAENNFTLPGSGDRYNLIADLLVKHADGGASPVPALYFNDQVISYGALYQSVGIARALLMDQGVMRGDRVALVLPDTPAYIYIFLAAISLGAIPVGINPNENASDIPALLKHIGAKCLVVSVENASLRQSLAQSEIASVLVEVDPLFEQATKAFVDNSAPCCDYEVMAANDVLYLTFSSGTTGRPKAVTRRHLDILNCAQSVDAGLMGLTPKDTVMTVTKLTFGYSLVGGLMFSLLAGASLVVAEEKMTVDKVIAAAKRYRPSVLLAQPRILTELNRHSEAGEHDWYRSLRMVMSAGDVLSASVRDKWTNLTGLSVTEGFGSVEVGHFFIAGNGEDMPQGALGKVLDGYQVQLIDDDGREVKQGQQGRLCIRGNSVTTGYWNDPQRTRAAFEQSWYVSDDVFTASGDYLFYAGRWDHMIKTGCGEWVSPVRIENVIRRDERVEDCAVMEARDEDGVSRVKAFIVPGNGSDPKELQGGILDLIECQWPQLDHMRVHLMEFVEAIPRSANGKIVRPRARR